MKFIPKQTHNPDLPVKLQEHIENQRKQDIINVAAFVAFSAVAITASAWAQRKLITAFIPVTETEE